jgi:hypothetical protein
MTAMDAQSPLALRSNERGIALIVTLMTLALLTALGLGLMVTTATEAALSVNNRDGAEAFYAADAGIERVMQDLLLAPDWNRILDGSVRSPFVDGPVGGSRTLPHDAGTLDLTTLTNMLNCEKATSCSAGDMNAYTLARPWGANNPRWQLYAYGPAQDLVGGTTINSAMYVVVWVADDPSENDNNPLQDGAGTGKGIISLRAEAFGPGGAHRVIESTVARTDSSELERGYTSQRGQDEQNRRARKQAVGVPGQNLTRSAMSVSTGGLTVR